MNSYTTVRKAVEEYVYFLTDHKKPEDASEASVYDSRRKILHDAVGEALGFAKESWLWHGFDEYTTNHTKWKDLHFSTIDDFIDWATYSLMDKASERRYSSDAVKTCYAFKSRINLRIEYLRKKIDYRLKDVEEVMSATLRNWRAWVNNEVHEGRTKFVSIENLNHHDYNRNQGAIKNLFKKINEFASMPREAYTEAAVATYYDAMVKQIHAYVSDCEAIAFRAERIYKNAPYYMYYDKKEKKDA